MSKPLKFVLYPLGLLLLAVCLLIAVIDGSLKYQNHAAKTRLQSKYQEVRIPAPALLVSQAWNDNVYLGTQGHWTYQYSVDAARLDYAQKLRQSLEASGYEVQGDNHDTLVTAKKQGVNLNILLEPSGSSVSSPPTKMTRLIVTVYPSE